MTNPVRTGALALMVLFGLAFILGMIEMLRGGPVRKTTTYGSLIIASALAGYLIVGGN